MLVYGRWLVMGGTKPVFQPVDNPAAFEPNPFKKVCIHYLQCRSIHRIAMCKGLES